MKQNYNLKCQERLEYWRIRLLSMDLTWNQDNALNGTLFLNKKMLG